MNEQIAYKAATVAAAVLADEKQPEQPWIRAIAGHLKNGNPAARKTFEAFLRAFEQPRLLHLLKQNANTTQDTSLLSEPLGKTVILYKSPLPGETQARLAYECFLDGFAAYLQRTRAISRLHETAAHVILFIPQGRSFDLDEMWQRYVRGEAFSRRGLAENFVSLLNSVQLAGRGFGVLDVPIISEDQRQILASFYLAAIQQVKGRLQWRANQIRTTEGLLANPSLVAKERTQSEKKLKTLQEKQQEEIEKYRSAFAKSLVGLLDKEEKAHHKASKATATRAKRPGKKTETPEESRPENPATNLKQERIGPMRKLLADTKGDPFLFLAQDQTDRPAAFTLVEQAATRFTERARNQLATTVGVKFAGVALEAYRLLDGEIPLTDIPPLFSLTAPTPIERPAGDAAGEWCYSCGKALGKKDPSYEVRRLLFSSPDQRPQSGSASVRPKACPTCAAVALTCPLKLSDQNVIVRLDPRGQQVGVADYLRDYCRMLTIGTLNTAAGRYLSLVCTERTAKGALANARLGQVVYTIAKLGLELPPDVFRDFRLSLITEGARIRVDAAVLFAAAGFLRGYGQRIIVGGDLNATLGKAVRSMQAGAFYAAEYTIIASGASFHDEINLENHRKELWEFLKQLAVEDVMTKSGEQRAKFYGDVAALTGFLYAFCDALRREVRKDPEQAEKDIGRILGKAIEYVDDTPNFFTYTAMSNRLRGEDVRLYKDSRHHFLYERAKGLLGEMQIAEEREHKEESATYLQLHFDDLTNAYTYFSQSTDYKGEREWKEFLYQVKLSLYSRFPECFAKAENNNN